MWTQDVPRDRPILVDNFQDSVAYAILGQLMGYKRLVCTHDKSEVFSILW